MAIPAIICHTAIIRFMDTSQTRIVELLREVHLIAFKEIERLNLRIAELESGDHPRTLLPIVTAPAAKPPKQHEVEIMNERQLSAHLNVSISTVRKWRRLRREPRNALARLNLTGFTDSPVPTNRSPVTATAMRASTR